MNFLPPPAGKGSHLSHDGLAAGSTHTLGQRLHPQLVEVRLQAAQHVVQLVDLRVATGGAASPLSHDLRTARQAGEPLPLQPIDNDNNRDNGNDSESKGGKREKQEVEAEPACIGGKTGSYSVWQPTDTRALRGSAGGRWVGGGGDRAGGVGGSRTGRGAVTARGGVTT